MYEILRSLVYNINKQVRFVSDTVIGNYFEADRDIVLITGGASGLGREIAVKFATNRAKVVVLDINLPPQKDMVSGVFYFKCDVSKREEIEICSQNVKKEVGQVTILINNAGIATGKLLIESGYDEIEKTIQVNLLSNFYTIKTFLPDMLKMRRGYVITIASVLGYMSPARLSAYGASKSGLIALHESLTYELGSPTFNRSGVKTLLICPGQIKTTMFRGIKTPSTLLAPELEVKYVADSVFGAALIGRRGEIRLPFYGNVLPVFRALPWPIVEIARKLSGIDKSVSSFKATLKEINTITVKKVNSVANSVASFSQNISRNNSEVSSMK